MEDAARLEYLRAEARYHRERRDLYVAKTYGSQATSAPRLRELERASELAQKRLARAERGGLSETATP